MLRKTYYLVLFIALTLVVTVNICLGQDVKLPPGIRPGLDEPIILLPKFPITSIVIDDINGEPYGIITIKGDFEDKPVSTPGIEAHIPLKNDRFISSNIAMFSLIKEAFTNVNLQVTRVVFRVRWNSSDPRIIRSIKVERK